MAAVKRFILGVVFTLFILGDLVTSRSEPENEEQSPRDERSSRFAHKPLPDHIGLDRLNSRMWQVGHEYVYNYSSRLMTGIPELNDKHYSGMALKGTIHIKVFSPGRLGIQLKDVKHTLINGMKSSGGGRSIASPPSNWRFIGLPPFNSVPEKVQRNLEQLTSVHIEPEIGRLRSFAELSDTPTWLTNLRRAILSLILVQSPSDDERWSGSASNDEEVSQRSRLAMNSVLDHILPQHRTTNEQYNSYSARIFENTVYGFCPVQSDLSLIPRGKSSESIDYDKYSKSKTSLYDCSKPFLLAPRSGKYSRTYELVKTRDSDSCRRKKGQYHYQPGYVSCATNENCDRMAEISSQSRYVICGDTEGNRVVKNIVNEGEIVPQLENYSSERVMMGTRQELVLLSMNKLEADGREEEDESDKSKYRIVDSLHHSEITNVQPFNYQSEIMKAVTYLVNEGFHSQHEVREMQLPKLIAKISFHITSLTLKQINDVYDELKQKLPSKIELLKDVYVDLVMMSGYHPGLEFILHHIQEFSDFQLSLILSKLPHTVIAPSPEYMNVMLRLVRHKRVSGPYLKHQAMFAMTSVIQEACFSRNKNRKFILNRFHKCDPASPPIKEWLIHINNVAIDVNSSPSDKAAAIISLGMISNKGHAENLKRCIHKPSVCKFKLMHRYIAIYSIINGLRYDVGTREMLAHLFFDTRENKNVRIAAFNSLLQMSPDYDFLHKVVMWSWYERDVDIWNVIATSFESISQKIHRHPYDSFDSDLTRKVRLLYPLMRRVSSHNSYASSNMYRNELLPDLDSGYKLDSSYLNNGHSAFPQNVWYRTSYYISQYKYTPLEIAIHFDGINEVSEAVIDILEPSGGPAGSTQFVDQLLNKLGTGLREVKMHDMIRAHVWANIYERSPMLVSVGMNSITRSIYDATRNVNSWPSFTRQMKFHTIVEPASSTSVILTDLGVTVYARQRHIILLGVDASLKPSASKGLLSFHLGGRVSMNSQSMSVAGFYCPISTNLVATHVDVNSYLMLPVDIKSDIDIIRRKISLEIAPEYAGGNKEVKTSEVVHLSVVPHTSIRPFSEIRNANRDEVMIVRSDEDRHVISKNLPMTTGYEARFIAETETPVVSYTSILFKLRAYNYNPLNMIRFFTHSTAFSVEGYTSIRYHSLTLSISPTRSNANERGVRVNLNGGMALKSEQSPSPYVPIIAKSLFGNDEELRKKASESLEKIDVKSGLALAVNVGWESKVPGSRLLKQSSILTVGYSNMLWKWNLDIAAQSQSLSEVCWNGSIDMQTSLMSDYRRIAASRPQLSFKTYIGYGHQCKDAYVDIEARLSKSKRLEQRVLDGEIVEELSRLERRRTPSHLTEARVSQLKREIREKASALDLLDIEVESLTPMDLQHIYGILEKVAKVYGYEYLTSNFYPLLYDRNSEGVESPSFKSTLYSTINLDPLLKTMSVLFKTDRGTMTFEEMPTPYSLSNLLPISTVNIQPHSSLLGSVLNRYVDSKCHVNLIGLETFDGHILNFNSNEGEDAARWTLLSGDCSVPASSYAVLIKASQYARQEYGNPRGNKDADIRVLIGGRDIRLERSVPNGRVDVFVDQVKQDIVLESGGAIWIEHHGQSPLNYIVRPEILIERSEDGLIHVRSNLIGVKLHEASSEITISVSPLYKSRVCGLCGNQNGISSDDLETVGQCTARTLDELIQSYRLMPAPRQRPPGRATATRSGLWPRRYHN